MMHFDPESHTYSVGGVKIPSVTTILKPLYDFSMIKPEVLQRKADIGQAVHLATEYHDQDDLDFDSLDPLIAGYVTGWVRFRRETGFTPRVIEGQYYHPLHRYAGTMDREGDYQGDPTILDVKTTVVMSPAVGVQLAAYTELYAANHPDKPKPTRRTAVQLFPDGTYRAKDYTDPGDFATFLSLLNIHRWKEKHL